MNRLLKIFCLVAFVGALGCGPDAKDKPPEIKKGDGSGKTEPPPAPSGKKPGGNEPISDLKPS